MTDRIWSLRMLAVLAGAAGLMISGCSKKEDASAPRPTASNQQVRTTKATPPQPVVEPANPTVVFRYPRLFADSQPLQKLLDQFHTEHTNITVQAEPLAPDATALQKNYSEALGANPAVADVVLLDMTWLATFAQAGQLRDLTDQWSEEERKEFFPGAVEATEYLGRAYALPWTADAGVIYYRKDLVEAQQLGPPRSWGDVMRLGTLIQQKNPTVQGYVWPTSANEDMVCAVLEFLYNNGGHVLNRDKVVVNSPDNLYALSFAANLISRYKITPAPSAEAKPRQQFIEGKAALIRDWTEAWAALEKAQPGQVGVVPLPAFPAKKPGSILKGWLLGVAAGSRQPKASLLLAKFLSAGQQEKALALAYPFTPAVATIYTHYEVTNARPELPQMLPALRLARPPLNTPEYSKVLPLLQAAFVNVLSGKATAESALQSLQQELQGKAPKVASAPPLHGLDGRDSAAPGASRRYSSR